MNDEPCKLNACLTKWNYQTGQEEQETYSSAGSAPDPEGIAGPAIITNLGWKLCTPWRSSHYPKPMWIKDPFMLGLQLAVQERKPFHGLHLIFIA